jgi:hypothetical protein
VKAILQVFYLFIRINMQWSSTIAQKSDDGSNEEVFREYKRLGRISYTILTSHIHHDAISVVLILLILGIKNKLNTVKIITDGSCV